MSVFNKPGDDHSVTLLKPSEVAEWDRFVFEHPQGTLFHGNQWRIYLEAAFPHIRGHFLVVRNPSSGRIVAGIPLYEVRSWILGKRLVAVPYANWCDPLISQPDHFGLILRASEVLARDLGADSIKFRLRKQKAPADLPEWTEDCNWLHHWTDLRSDPNELLHKFSRTAIQQLIKKAEKSGTHVVQSNSTDSYINFHRLLSRSRRGFGLPPIPFRFFSRRQQLFGDHIQTLLLAYQESRLLGAVTLLVDSDTCHLEFAGSAADTKNLGIMQLLYWRGIERAQDSGCSAFSFGRTSINHPGLATYKRRWNSIEEPLRTISWHRNPRAKADPTSDRLKSISPVIERIIRHAPLSVSRLIGIYLYRHW